MSFAAYGRGKFSEAKRRKHVADALALEEWKPREDGKVSVGHSACVIKQLSSEQTDVLQARARLIAAAPKGRALAETVMRMALAACEPRGDAVVVSASFYQEVVARAEQLLKELNS